MSKSKIAIGKGRKSVKGVPVKDDWYMDLSDVELLSALDVAETTRYSPKLSAETLLVVTSYGQLEAERKRRGLSRDVVIDESPKTVSDYTRQVFSDGSTQCPKCHRVLREESHLHAFFKLCHDCVRSGMAGDTVLLQGYTMQIERLEREKKALSDARNALISVCSDFSIAMLAHDRNEDEIQRATMRIVGLAHQKLIVDAE